MVLNNVQDNSQREPFTGFPPSGSTLCPRCEYDLQGLPLDYQCPECGLAYDRRSKLWREAKTKEAGRLRVGWFSAVSLLTIVGILLYTVYSGQIEWLPSIAMVTTLPTWMVYFMARRRVARAALGPAGIVYADTFRRPHLIEWSQIRSIYLHEYELARPLELRLVNNKTVWAEQLCKTCANAAELKSLIAYYASEIIVRESEG